MSERDLQEVVLDLARINGWKAYHTFDSRRSEPGFPDVILLRGPRMIAAELKSATGKLTPEQGEWLAAFAAVREVEAMVIREAPERAGPESERELVALLADRPPVLRAHDHQEEK